MRIIVVILVLAFSVGQNLSASENNSVQELLPEQGFFEFIYNLPVAVEDDTAVVLSELKNTIHVFERNESGEWHRQADIVPTTDTSIDIYQLQIVGGKLFFRLSRQGTLIDIISYSKNDAGEWVRSPFPSVAGVDADDSFTLDETGTRLLTIKTPEQNSELRVIRFLKLDANGTWETELEVTEAVQVPQKAGHCISEDRAVVNGKLYVRGEGEDWVASRFEVPPVPAGRGSYYVSSDSSCHYSVVMSGTDENPSVEIWHFDDNSSWVVDFYAGGVEGFIEAYNDRYVLVSSGYYDDNPKNDSVLVFERLDSGQWVERGYLNTEAYQGGFGKRLALDGNTAIVSSLVPAVVTAFDLSQYDYKSVTRGCTSGYPNTDLDNDGYGWEAGKTCLVNSAELQPSDSRRGEYINVDRSYTGPIPSADIADSYDRYDTSRNDYEPVALSAPLAVDGNTAVRITESDANRILVDIYRTSDGAQWSVEQSIDFTEMLESEFPVLSEWRFPSILDLRIDIDEDILAIGAQSRGIYDYGGAVFIFKRSVNNTWEFAFLVNESFTEWGGYASAVAVSGDYLAVRSGDLGGEGGNGARIHIYKNNGQDEWLPDSVADDRRHLTPRAGFGHSLALDGDTMILSERHLWSRNYSYAGIYVRDGEGGWRHQQTLYPGDGTGLGVSVDLKGDTALVELSGKMYIFKKDTTGLWVETAVLSGADLVIRHGGVWARDKSLPVDQLEYGVNLYPVEFLFKDRAQGSSESVASETDTCIDTGLIGDGWGWNGTESCRVDVVIDRCIYDFAYLNSGWGWNPATMSSCPPR